MKLLTTIKPRLDGTVILTGEDKKRYVFAPDANGALIADIDDLETCAKALARGIAEPADAESAEQAMALMSEPDGAGQLDDDYEDDPGDYNAESGAGGAPAAAPEEAGTPPAAAPGRGRGRRAAGRAAGG